MKLGKWISAAALTVLLSSGSIALAQGKGHGKGHDKHGNDDDQDAQFYKGHDREVIGGWYDEHRGQLPPGLAKKDRLPPGLEKQLVRGDWRASCSAKSQNQYYCRHLPF